MLSENPSGLERSDGKVLPKVLQDGVLGTDFDLAQEIINVMAPKTSHIITVANFGSGQCYALEASTSNGRLIVLFIFCYVPVFFFFLLLFLFFMCFFSFRFFNYYFFVFFFSKLIIKLLTQHNMVF